MPEDNDLRIFLDLVGAIQHFVERVTVQRQLSAILITLLVSWVIAYLIRYVASRWAVKWVDEWLGGRPKMHLAGRKRTVAPYVSSIGRNIVFPLLVIIGLGRAEQFFFNHGYQAGLLSGFLFFFWIVFFYRLILGVLYARLDKPAAKRYHYRFLAPLLAVLTLAWLLNHFIPIRQLAAVQVWRGLSNPVTFGAVFVATVGFYFWFDGSGVLQDIARFLIRPFANVHSGSLEAGLIIGRYILIAAGVYVVFYVLGFDSTTLAFLTAGLSVGIGFGLKEVIGNLISGVLLLVDQSLRPGDVISIDGQIGTVRHVGIRATIVKTLNNVDVVVPNQTFLTATVTTYSKDEEPVRMLIPVETSDAHPPHDVREAMLTAARTHPLVLKDPHPEVFYINTGDTSRQYELAVWYKDPLQTVPLHSQLYYRIFDEFDRRKINPATPQRDLNINTMPWSPNAGAAAG